MDELKLIGKVVKVTKSPCGRNVRILCDESYIINISQSSQSPNFFNNNIRNGDKVKILIESVGEIV